MACDALAANPRLTLESAFAHSVDGRSLSMKATNFSLHWTGSSRFSLVPIATALVAAPGQ